MMIRRLVVAGTLTLGMALTAGPSLAQDATPMAAEQAAPTDFAIEVGEYFINPASTTLIAGQPYHFMVTNKGLTTHELVIEPLGANDEPMEANGKESEVEDIAKGETKDFTWTIDKPGDYQFVCYVADHKEHGMLVPFTVVPKGTETVKVSLDDFTVTSDTAELKADVPYLFQVTNKGKATHELVIEPADAVDQPFEIHVDGKEKESEVEDIAPGQTKTLLWTFSDAGDYMMACHVPGHFEAGMKATFTVKK